MGGNLLEVFVMEGVHFSAEVLEKAKKFVPEKDEVLPGTWHVISGDHEYRVQTDEDPELEEVHWASCSCPHGMLTQHGIPHCSHVAAVLMAIMEGE
jgi:hypothetical protein